LNANLSWLLPVRRDDQTVNVRGQNADVASGGQGSESLDDSRLRAREIFRKQSPVLTTSDYERLVLRTPGLRVARVKVLPNFNPNISCVRLSGDVTVIVVPSPPPAASFPDAAPPKPSAGFLKTVETYLDRRRLVTTNLHVIGPEYVAVNVSCRVFLNKRVSESEAKASVLAALKQLLDPVFGGPERGKGWPFGRSVFPSEINQRLAQLPAVDYVVGVRLNDLQPGESLPLAYNELPMPGTPDIRLIPFEWRGKREVDSRDEGACD
jgi:predicted phage baseplate assembly protein